jgi:hypothetical protein
MVCTKCFSIENYAKSASHAITSANLQIILGVASAPAGTLAYSLAIRRLPACVGLLVVVVVLVVRSRLTVSQFVR